MKKFITLLLLLLSVPSFAAHTIGDLNPSNSILNMNSHRITNVTDPSSAQDAATKAYTDAVASGLALKTAVNLTTAAALPTNIYDNGSSGVGATLTGVSFGALTVDGVAVQSGWRIIVKNEAAPANNGVYEVTVVGDIATVYILTRTTDADTSAELVSAFAFTSLGDTNATDGFVQTTPATITIGTTAINFTQFSQAGTFTEGDNIDITGQVISAIPSGNDTELQFNDGGAIGADSGLTYDKTSNSLTATGVITAGQPYSVVIGGVAVDPQMMVNSDSLSGHHVVAHSDTGGDSSVILQARSGGTTSSPSIVQASWILGTNLYAGYDGTDYANAAAIIVTVDGTPGSNDMPGRMTFYTTPDGTGNLTSRMTIGNDGAIQMFQTLDVDGGITANLTGDVLGNLTGNVTGNVSGTSGSTTGNAATATALQTPRTINGTSFNGTANITVTSDAGTLTGTTLNSTVVDSSLTSVGKLNNLDVFNPYIGISGVWTIGGATATNTIGWTATATGTATAIAITSTSLFTRTTRINYASAAGAGSTAAYRSSQALAIGSAGYKFVAKTGVEINQSGSRGFSGMTAALGVHGNVNPSTLTNIIGAGWDTTDTTLQIMHNDGGGAATKVNLGANFPTNTSATDLYQIEFSTADGTTVDYFVTRLNTGHTASGTLSTNLPATTQVLSSQVWLNNGATAASVRLAFSNIWVGKTN